MRRCSFVVYLSCSLSVPAYSFTSYYERGFQHCFSRARAPSSTTHPSRSRAATRLMNLRSRSRISLPESKLSNCAVMAKSSHYATTTADDNLKTIDGYEYIHPDIAAMLTAKVQNDCKDSDCAVSTMLFEVDQDSLTLKRESKIQDHQDVLMGRCTTETMSIDQLQLAGLADQCDKAVFGTDDNIYDHLPKKISGLIRLSQLTKSNNDMECETMERSSEVDSGVHHHHEVLVACMISLNLLESSIRTIVMEYRRRNEKSKDKTKNANDKTDSKSPKAKGAPLLRDMIQAISHMDEVKMQQSSSTRQKSSVSAACLAPVLRALLLPTTAGGVNLRNLVSHGFLSTIDRRWFSLTLVLMQTLDSLSVSNTNKCVKEDRQYGKDGSAVDGNDGTSSSLTKYSPLANEVNYGRSILFQNNGRMLQDLERQARALIPPTHMPLLRFCFEVLAPNSGEGKHSATCPSLMAISATVMCSLFEHSLRLLWCKENNRPEDRMARPSKYYVTLDGHGQRDKHEVVITPYLQDGVNRNQLIPIVGAPSIAMLSDIFAAPSVDAPNIRSALCHGSWDGEIVRELELLSSFSIDANDPAGRSNQSLLDTACALVSCLDLIASHINGNPRLPRYRPVYTYTASAQRSLDQFCNNLSNLDALIADNASILHAIRSMEEQQPKLCGELCSLRVDFNSIKALAASLFDTLSKADEESWTIDDIYFENETNIALAENIAALTLLSDASATMKALLAGVNERLEQLTIEPKSTKERRAVKTATRYCSAVMIARDFYTCGAFVALIAAKQKSLRDDSLFKPSGKRARNDQEDNQDRAPYFEQYANRDDIIKACERSRMTISTFDSHLATNLDRSLKALQQYMQGKAVKKVMALKYQFDVAG